MSIQRTRRKPIFIRKRKGSEWGFAFEISRTEQIEKTARVLVEEMLYLKFIQGIPLIGVAGGLSDVFYQKKIADFAELKYHKRFLEKQRAEMR